MSSVHTIGPARRAVMDALNGDKDRIDSAVRRALIALCEEADEHSHASQMQYDEMIRQLRQVRALLVSTSVSFLLVIGAALLNVFLN